MEHTFIGFHGTSKHRARKIVRSGMFKFSMDSDSHAHWLGDGIYFFQEQLKWAVKYAIEVKKFTTDPAVVKCIINCADLLDMEDPDDRDFFEYVAQNIINRCQSNGEEVRLINGKIFNFIYNNIRKFDVARSAFSFDSDITKPNTNNERWVTVPVYHIQLCVRNPRCITSLERVV